MFVYYYAYVDRSFSETDAIVSKLLAGMSDAADIAYRRAEDLLARVHPEGHRIAKTVRLDVGEPFRRTGETSIPLRWEATGTPGLFPKMEADLVVEEVGIRLTKVALQGSYDPPLGSLGRALDRALLHRVAEATVKHFVDRIGCAITGWPSEQRR